MRNRDAERGQTELARAFAIDLIDYIHAADPGAVEAWAESRDDIKIEVL